MKFKGHNFRPVHNLLSRLSKEGDTYANGDPVPHGHYVVVKPEDCTFLRKEGNANIFETRNAKCIDDMTGHSLTNMFYGKWKLRHSERGTVVDNLDTGSFDIAHEYFQCTVYMMQRGRVYKASIQRAVSTKQLKIVTQD